MHYIPIKIGFEQAF